jgi:hypothetical protein
MGLILNTSTIIRNLSIGPLSGGGGGGGGGGGSSEPSYLAVGAYGHNSLAGAAYVYDASNYSTAPTKLTPSGLAAGDRFGWSVATTANHVVVSAIYDDDQGSDTGAVYVYDASNLSATPTKLAPSGLGNFDYFGYSVAATSNHIIISNQDDAQGYAAGAVYVYDASNLSATPTILTPSGLQGEDFFGWSISANSSYIVIGARGDDDQGSGAGAVYVYDATNLSASPTKLTPTGLGASDNFGADVAITSNHIVVGANNDDDQGDNAGAVYVYDATNLSAAPTKLAPSGIGAGDRFGDTVTATSDHIIVGARLDDDQGSNAGAVYVFDASNLSTTPTKLAPTGLDENDQFGFYVTAAGSQIVVGAISDDDQGNAAGAVYVYDASNLSATPTKLTASDGSDDDEFGRRLSLG